MTLYWEEPVEDVQFISLGEVPAYMARSLGITRTRQTIYNWAKVGVKMGLGKTIRLKAVKQANRLMTTRQWVREFVEEVSEIEAIE